MASLYVKDEETNALATRLAHLRGISKTAAVKLALEHELTRTAPPSSLRERLRAWREAHPLGEQTGLKADKAFYDSLNDEDDD